MCVGFVTLTFTLDFYTICTQNPKTILDRECPEGGGSQVLLSGVIKSSSLII